jgi:hypothetical protein
MRRIFGIQSAVYFLQRPMQAEVYEVNLGEAQRNRLAFVMR